MRIAVVSDTHLPRRGRALPQRLLDECAAADLILHAGDVVAPEVLLELEAYGTVAAVRGNCDGDDLAQLPLERVVEAGDARIGMVHDSGRSDGRGARLARRFPGCAAVVFGHSHVPVVAHEAGVLLVNPGSPTDPRGQPAPTMALLEVADGRLTASLVDVSAPTR
jgi:putative phosphoesterase